MTAKKTLTLLLVVVISVLGIVWFNVSRERSTITIGAILPLTGQAQAYGEDAQHALELLEEESKAEGTPERPTVKFVYGDDQMDERAAMEAYRTVLGGSRLAGIIGAMGSSAALALAPNLEKDRIVLISPTASSPRLTGTSRFFFRVWPPDGAEGAAMAKHARQTLHLSRVAIVYENNDFGQSISEVFSEAFVPLGGTIVQEDGFSSKTSDFRPMVRSAVTADAEAIYVPSYYAPLAVLLKHAREVAPRLAILGASPAEDGKLVELAGGAAQGLIFTRPKLDPTRPSPAYVSFRQRYEHRVGKSPGPAATYTYDAAAILLDAINKVGLGAENIAAHVRNLREFPGVTGPITFDERGELVREFDLATVRNGTFVPYEVAEATKPEPPASGPARAEPGPAAPTEPATEAATPEPTSALASSETITVKPGEYLHSIAKRVYGDASKWRLIYDANRDQLSNPDTVRVGMKLLVPPAN